MGRTTSGPSAENCPVRLSMQSDGSPESTYRGRNRSPVLSAWKKYGPRLPGSNRHGPAISAPASAAARRTCELRWRRTRSNEFNPHLRLAHRLNQLRGVDARCCRQFVTIQPARSGIAPLKALVSSILNTTRRAGRDRRFMRDRRGRDRLCLRCAAVRDLRHRHYRLGRVRLRVLRELAITLGVVRRRVARRTR